MALEGRRYPCRIESTNRRRLAWGCPKTACLTSQVLMAAWRLYPDAKKKVLKTVVSRNCFVVAMAWHRYDVSFSVDHFPPLVVDVAYRLPRGMVANLSRINFEFVVRLEKMQPRASRATQASDGNIFRILR